jgi:hypothetical protein|tara:strand:- start:5129 stop:5443 length:315 start_codon:yes stop_codon:yes gene_type:complete
METSNINDVIEHYFNKQYPIVDGIIQVPINYGDMYTIDNEVSEMLGIEKLEHFITWAESKLGNVIEIQFTDKKIIYYDGIFQSPYIEISAEEFKRMVDIIGVRK